MTWNIAKAIRQLRRWWDRVTAPPAPPPVTPPVEPAPLPSTPWTREIEPPAIPTPEPWPDEDLEAQEPEHKPHPPVESCFPLKTDLCGIRVPSIAQFSRTDVMFLPIVGLYPPEVRGDCYGALEARGFNCTVNDPRPKYGDYYPRGVLSVDAFRGLLCEQVDRGLVPVNFWLPDDQPATAETWDALIFPYLADHAIRERSKINAAAWEMNDWMTPDQIVAALRWLRARLEPDALLYCHFTPDHAAGSMDPETECQWWRRLTQENLIDGIFLQLQPYATLEEQVSRIEDFTTRLTGGLNQWPTKQADGSPLRVIVFEHDAYLAVRGRVDESHSQARRKVFEVIPGVSGVMDRP